MAKTATGMGSRVGGLTTNPKPQTANPKVNADEVRAKHKEFLFPCVTNYYEEPLVITEGKGARVRDANGRDYLDFFGGILTLGVGHCNDEVVSRVQTQLERLGHTSTL